MANSVDPDEMAGYNLSHLDLHCLLGYPFWSNGVKGLNIGRPYPLIILILKFEEVHFILDILLLLLRL